MSCCVAYGKKNASGGEVLEFINKMLICYSICLTYFEKSVLLGVLSMSVSF